MANRNNRQQGGNRRMDFGRVDRKGYGRPMPPPVSPWQQGPSAAMGGVLPLASSSEATLALANNLINNLLQARQATVPSLLDMPIRRDFVGDPNRGFDRGFNRMGVQPNFRRGPGNYVRPSDRPNYRRNFKPNDGQKNKQGNKKDSADSKQKVKAESAEPEKETDEKKDAAAKESIKEEVKEESAGEASADADEKKDGEEKDAEKKDGEKKDAPKTAYDGINPALLHCHICNKVMWDGRSFENHLNGRAHHIMMQKTNESYALTADTMRQELKIREMKHYRKLGQNGPRNFFCTMCDMYAADGSAHRTTIGHRKLKKYLHPTCTSCHKEMPTRIDLDEHRLSPEHLLSVQGRRKDFSAKPKAEGIQTLVISTLNTEESYVRFDRKDHGKRARDAAAGEKEKEKEDGGEEGGEEDKAGEVAESDKTILDWKEGDDMSEVTPDMIPRYMPERGVGRSFLGEFSCVQCKLCRKLLDSQETAEVHLRTWRHHLLFVKHLQRKSKPHDAQSELGKRASADEEEEDSSSSKRRKTAADNAEEDTATNGDHDEDYEELEDEEEENAEEENAEEEGAEGVAVEGTDVEMKEQELWEKDLALIINNVNTDQEAAKEAEPVEEKAPVVEETPEPSPTATPSKAKATRGRGRGRGRAKRI